MKLQRLHPGILAALTSAVLFGLGTPFAKTLLKTTDPWLLAGLLYLGSGIGLTMLRWARPSTRTRLSRTDWVYVVAGIVAGGVIAPVLLMQGLVRTPASGASLLLNAEGVLTALLAWFVFRKNVDRRIAFGMLAIVAGAICLTWTADWRVQGPGPALLIVGACLAWILSGSHLSKASPRVRPTFSSRKRSGQRGPVLRYC